MIVKFKENNIDIEKIEQNDKKFEDEINEKENVVTENNKDDSYKDDKEDEDEEENDELDDDEENDLDSIDEFREKHKGKKISKFDLKEKNINFIAIKRYEDSLRKIIKDYDKYGSEYEKLCKKCGKEIKSSLSSLKKE